MMTGSLVHGDHVSCSRLGGAMRRESARLRVQAEALSHALGDLEAGGVPRTDTNLSPASVPLTDTTAMADITATSLLALRAISDDLDSAGASLQRYATELAESHELGRRAQLRVQGAGLLLEGTRVIEPWGPASAQDADRRQAQTPEVQSRVDQATAHLGRARGRLRRDMIRLTECFSAHSRDLRTAPPTPLSPHGS